MGLEMLPSSAMSAGHRQAAIRLIILFHTYSLAIAISAQRWKPGNLQLPKILNKWCLTILPIDYNQERFAPTVQRSRMTVSGYANSAMKASGGSAISASTKENVAHTLYSPSHTHCQSPHLSLHTRLSIRKPPSLQLLPPTHAPKTQRFPSPGALSNRYPLAPNAPSAPTRFHRLQPVSTVLNAMLVSTTSARIAIYALSPPAESPQRTATRAGAGA